MPDELYQIYANKTAINKKRTTLVGKGFLEYGYYWSSLETSYKETYGKIRYYEYCVALDNGAIFSTYKNNGYSVLAFLALEY